MTTMTTKSYALTVMLDAKEHADSTDVEARIREALLPLLSPALDAVLLVRVEEREDDRRDLFLTIDDGRLIGELRDVDAPFDQERAERVVIHSVAQAEALIRRFGGAQCSSSLDFPEEYTENPDVLYMCRELRG